MNAWDNDNLVWMLTCSEQEFNEWCDQATNDDITYALELMSARKATLALYEAELMDDVVNLQQAQTVLDRFRLK